jgi:hypothetical protein
MSNSSSTHWLDRGPGEGVTENNEVVNLVAFLFFVVAIMFACFGRKHLRNRKDREENEEEPEFVPDPENAVAP